MRQALHILTKDVRRLWYEILVVLALEAAFVWMASGQGQGQLIPLFLLPWWYLIVRVIHMEPIPGDRQFWLTRPYAWKSLLGAKALFIVIFVSVPMLMADGTIVTAQGFALGSCVSALLWKQVMWTVMFVLPTAAIAAVTGKLGDAILVSALILLAVFAGSPVAYLSGAGNLGLLEWIRDSVVMLALAAIVAQNIAMRETAVLRREYCQIRITIAAASAPLNAPDATVLTIDEPLAHIRRDFEIPSVRLADYEARLPLTPR